MVWKNMQMRKNKYYSTSIKNHCVVEKQLSVSFELFVTSVFPFIHFLQRPKNKKARVTSVFACIMLPWLEHGQSRIFPC